jgi:hypothetical protein
LLTRAALVVEDGKFLKLGDTVELEDISVTKAAYNLKGAHIDLQSSGFPKPPENPGGRGYFIPAVTQLPDNLKISGTDTVEPGTASQVFLE